jgi:four helix bundle protein
MLKIFAVVLDVIRRMRTILTVIERKDRDLARQLRRCSASVALNLAEGMYSRGLNRAAKYHVALGSAREMLACLEVAEAFGYVGRLDAALAADCNRIVGSLVSTGLARRPCNVFQTGVSRNCSSHQRLQRSSVRRLTPISVRSSATRRADSPCRIALASTTTAARYTRRPRYRSDGGVDRFRHPC